MQGRNSGSALLAEQIFMLRTSISSCYAAAMMEESAADLDFLTFTTRIQNEFLRALRRRDLEEVEAMSTVRFQVTAPFSSTCSRPSLKGLIGTVEAL